MLSTIRIYERRLETECHYFPHAGAWRLDADVRLLCFDAGGKLSGNFPDPTLAVRPSESILDQE
jgi:hypothetical protein